MKSVDPLELLANGIVLQAISDYRRLWNWRKTDYAKRELIEFFHSEWFALLTKIDPEWLIERLEKEADAERKRYIR